MAGGSGRADQPVSEALTQFRAHLLDTETHMQEERQQQSAMARQNEGSVVVMGLERPRRLQDSDLISISPSSPFLSPLP